ncbi:MULTISPECIES: hypothetical protein [Rhodomicrobium]|uniref:hypothetical protein n=1 Tax=Rhodomicrobium TaxID=1068 RepID=UPI000F74A9C0|nr:MULTISPECIES: hypothetical protein [Rhodomicrobium]
MRAMATLLGVMLAAGLNACTAGGLPKMALLDDGADEAKSQEAAAIAADKGVDVANAPPVPDREQRRRKPGAATAAKASPAPAQTAAPEDASKKTAGLSLPSLGDVKIFAAPAAYAPDSVQWEQDPVGVYSVLAQQIRACWLKPGVTKLPDHGFHADVAPGDKDATIIIFKKDEEGRRGPLAFRIQISSDIGGGSTVRAENRRLDAKMDSDFKADLARWAKGKPEC